MNNQLGKKARQKAQLKGHMAEYYAAIYLMLKGYRIANMRFKTKLGEIDIIARKGNLAIFVEVKARAHIQTGVDAVSFQSKQRISNASDLWLAKQKNPHLISQRYDIIIIRPWRLPSHFLDAF